MPQPLFKRNQTDEEEPLLEAQAERSGSVSQPQPGTWLSHCHQALKDGSYSALLFFFNYKYSLISGLLLLFALLITYVYTAVIPTQIAMALQGRWV
jgi:hypothetical protein